MSTLYNIWSFIRHHKYIITIIFFAVIILFVGEDCYWARRQRNTEIERLRNELQAYQRRFEEDSRALEQLEKSPLAVEKYARERYHMKRSNEDIYLIVGKHEENDSVE